VFGRSHFTVSYLGANVYPENVTVGLEQPAVSGWGTGKFVLEVAGDADANPRLHVTVELAPGERPDAARERLLAESIRAQLHRLNSEFAHYVPAASQRPAVTLRPAGDPGHEVIAQVTGGYTTAITTSASGVFAKPSTLTFPEAASLLLAGTTAADLLHTSGAGHRETVLLHGAAGAVGTSVLQQARVLGVRVVAPLARRTSASSGASAGSPSHTGLACSTGSGPPLPRALPPRWTRSAATRPATPRWPWSRTGPGW